MALAKFSETDDDAETSSMSAAHSASMKVMKEVVAPNLSCPSCGYFFKGKASEVGIQDRTHRIAEKMRPNRYTRAKR